MNAWQSAALAALVIAAIVGTCAVLAGAPWHPTHLLVLMLGVATLVALVVAFGRSRRVVAPPNQSLTACIGCSGSLLFQAAQVFALPLDTVDHRDLDCALIWMTLILIANAVSSRRI